MFFYFINMFLLVLHDEISLLLFILGRPVTSGEMTANENKPLS